MKILIDTNILIHLEDNKIIEKEFSKFYKLAVSNGCKILYHPQAIPKDIGRDKDLERRAVILSKLNKYERLENFAIPSNEFLAEFKNFKINDQIDNSQLYQLYKCYVDYFVTQDKGIHLNAQKIGLSTTVLDINQASVFLEKSYTIKIPSHPILREHSIREIEELFRTDFFESLRTDYEEDKFNSWLQKCVQNDRKCYSLIVEKKLQALLIYNIEKVEDHKIANVFDKALKICTLKVSNDAFGIKLGELFLNKMFEFCINQKINFLYLTVYEKQVQLIELLEKFGFLREVFTNSQGFSEIRMIKYMDKGRIQTKENSILIHPFYVDHNNVNKYAVPIRPEYYETLFKDGKLRPPTFFDSSPDSVNEIQGNTIIKAYISKTNNNTLKQGDILFFYSSQTNKTIEPIGILESAQRVNNFDDLWEIVRKKTVFSPEKLLDMLTDAKELHVIVFRLVTYMDRKIGFKRIQKIDSFKNKIQTITRLNEVDYLALKKDGYFDERYIIN